MKCWNITTTLRFIASMTKHINLIIACSLDRKEQWIIDSGKQFAL